MWDHEEKSTLRELLHACIELVHDLTKAVRKYLAETPSGTTLKGSLMANYQLNTGDSVVVTITDSASTVFYAWSGHPGCVDGSATTAIVHGGIKFSSVVGAHSSAIVRGKTVPPQFQGISK